MIFSRVTLEANAKLSHTKNLNMSAADLNMRSASVIVAELIHLDVGALHVEGGAKLDVSGRGSGAQGGYGAGVVLADGAGAGGTHGGFGGGADPKTATTGTTP